MKVGITLPNLGPQATRENVPQWVISLKKKVLTLCGQSQESCGH